MSTPAFCSVVQQFDDFLFVLAKPQHDSGFGNRLRAHLLCGLEQAKRPRVVGLESNRWIQPRHRFNVVRKNIGAGFKDGSNAVERALKVRGQQFDL